MKTLLKTKRRAPKLARPVPGHVPLATYRLQMNKDFPFPAAQKIIAYLEKLGISDCYLSPISKSRRGSAHGYDIVDPKQVNPELGGEDAFQRFTREVVEKGLHLLLDVVPNHMCIMDPDNIYWMDVLENGPASPYAKYFDINWSPSKKELANKVLLPVLGDQYGKVLEAGEIRLAFEEGRFWIRYFEWKLPVEPRSWEGILKGVLKKISARYENQNTSRMELESILTSLGYLPTETETSPVKKQERTREKEVLKKRFAQLVAADAFIAEALQKELDEFNGRKGQPRSFDQLEELLSKQAYRLCDWKVAADEINYRRFFDINELAAIRVEDDEIFREIHQAVFDWIKKGWVEGLRVDHVDGLLDPQKYLELLQAEHGAGRPAGQPPLYITVEKILSKDEALPARWPVSGSTGYDFLNLVNGLFVEAINEGAIERIYRKFSKQSLSFTDVVVTSKKFIMLISMPSELRMLSLFLDGISEQHRWSRDFTQESLRFALREVVACFPVYRTYIREPGSVSEADRAVIAHAIAEAKRRNPATPESIFDFIGSVLTLNHPEGLSDEQKKERFEFVLRFQQFTGPVMAKGLEDTSFYRFVPLLSLNEVGGNPTRFGTSRREFHHAMAQRQKKWPHAMSASSTHDTKRSEDVRARINVLSEVPTRWGRALRRWHKLNLPHKSVPSKDTQIPNKNEEYLLYQTLVGSWPLETDVGEDFSRRIQDFFLKAVREGKTNSSWVKPNADYEASAQNFVKKILDPKTGGAFLEDFKAFNASITRAGLYNALAQTILKIASPGVPDFYQGTENWDFSLVDPDNRRDVDYVRYEKDLASLETTDPQDFLRNINDGRLKMFFTYRGLALRRRLPLLFQEGSYIPLIAEGSRRRNVVAFARHRNEEAVVAITGRFFMDFEEKEGAGIDGIDWADTFVPFPSFMEGWSWENVFTGKVLQPGRTLVKDALSFQPGALFARINR